jgi:hypothetical protein
MEVKKRKERYKLRINRRDTLYVDDEPEHTMMMVELIGRPIEYQPGIAGEFVSRRSVTFQDLVGGSGPMHGYVMANFQKGSVYSRFEGTRDGGTKITKGTWTSYKGTGQLTGVKGEGTFKVTEGERRGEYILDIEGEYEVA